MSRKSVRFIVNPFSGTSDKKDFSTIVAENIDQSKYEYDILLTEGPAHATTLSRSAHDQDIDIVVAVGGDGTVNEVASALVGTQTHLGIIPAGSGNGFAMHLGLGRKMPEAIQLLNQGEPNTIDTCTVNDEFYINVAGVGFDAKVAKLTKEKSKRGFRVYFEGALKEAVRYKNQMYTVTLDNQPSYDAKYFSINVANASMFGYNFVIAPLADLQDGILDAMFIKHATKIEYIASMYRFLNRTLHKSHITDLKKIQTIKINSEDPIFYHKDGEGFLTEDELTFKIKPSSLSLWVPKKSV